MWQQLVAPTPTPSLLTCTSGGPSFLGSFLADVAAATTTAAATIAVAVVAAIIASLLFLFLGHESHFHDEIWVGGWFGSRGRPKRFAEQVSEA